MPVHWTLYTDHFKACHKFWDLQHVTFTYTMTCIDSRKFYLFTYFVNVSKTISVG